MKINFKNPQKLASYANGEINLKRVESEILDCKKSTQKLKRVGCADTVRKKKEQEKLFLNSYPVEYCS